MRWLGVMVHSALLGIALIAALLTWQHKSAKKTPTAKNKETVELWSFPHKAVDEVRYEQKKQNLRVTMKRAEKGLPFLHERKEIPAPKRKPKPKTGDGQSDAPAEPVQAAPTVREKRARGNEKATQLLEQLVKLEATRDLGQLPAERLAKLGLSPAQGALTVISKGTERKLELGESTFGTPGFYARDAKTQTVYIVEPKVFNDLKWALSRLSELDPFGQQAKSAATVSVQRGSAQKRFSRLADKGKKKPLSTSRWAGADDPDREDSQGTELLRQLFRLRANKYVYTPLAGTQLATFAVLVGEKELAQATLFKIPPKPGKPTKYYMQSSFLESTLEVNRHQAVKVERAIDKVLGPLFTPGVSAPESPATPAPAAVPGKAGSTPKPSSAAPKASGS